MSPCVQVAGKIPICNSNGDTGTVQALVDQLPTAEVNASQLELSTLSVKFADWYAAELRFTSICPLSHSQPSSDSTTPEVKGDSVDSSTSSAWVTRHMTYNRMCAKLDSSCSCGESRQIRVCWEGGGFCGLTHVDV